MRGVSRVPEGAFRACPALEHITMHDGVTHIAPHAFAHCPSLASVRFPAGLGEIGHRAFALSGLRSADLPRGVHTIGSFAFYRCGALLSASLPDGLASMGMCAFTECSQLTSVAVVRGRHHGGAVRGLGGAAVVVQPDEGVRCFEFCSGLERVHLPDGLRRLGYRMFGDCAALVELHLPRGAAHGQDMFRGCDLLRVVHINGWDRHWIALKLW